MMLIFGLMLLLQTTACLDLFCRFDQFDLCYAALGHKLNLLMVLDASKYDLGLRHRINNTQDDPVCRVKNGRMKDCDLYNNRPEVTVINGTLIIKRVIRADSGNYTLKLSPSDGTETSRDLQVIVEAPIGSVEVSISCSSSGVMRASCSSEGDQLLYNWTLNGDPLIDGNRSIDLDEETDGNISCSVKNHVSHGQKTVRVKPCPGPTTAPVTSSLTSTSTQTSDYSLELNCSFNQSDSCYAALGHKLKLPMVLDASKYDLQLKKRINNNTAHDLVCRVKNDKMRECDLYNNRAEVTVINGTLIINHVTKADSGNYTLTLSHSDGTELFQGNLQVIVEAPIGSVEVSISCSSSGVMRASCSSEGDQLLYSWTLNGDPLMVGNSSIDLDERTDGNICCSVKNHVSHGQKTIRVKPCPGLDRFCRFDQSDPCYAALGHKLNLLMVLDTTPIGSVEVSISCSSNQTSVSCSSEGDQIIYNWTLNGIILEQGPMVRNTTIQLNEGTDGNISCSVKNNVSYGEKTIRVKPCPVPTTPAVTSTVTSTVSSTTQTSHYGTSFSSAGTNQTLTQSTEANPLTFVVYLIAGCAVLIVILLFITACYVYKKKRLKSTPDAAGDTELTYADISEKKESLPTADGEYAAVRRQTKRKERKKEEDEVQYGEVTFISNRSKALQPQEECIYSQVVRR
ncbi:uncharacterized protein LOC127158121 [Labeo rohita]|uniref:uncharacterized protein LOC127158121 n=1 Tax=Labeo rohita TaxID=84645 RepID=UPI0021E1CF91|nr:uncharacterized protein LOC127158121 [Labeo rohita]